MQSKLQLIHGCGQQGIGAGGQAYSNGYAAGFSFASGLSTDHATVKERHRSNGKIPMIQPLFLPTCTCPLSDIFTLPQSFKGMAFCLHMTLSGLRQQAQPTNQQQVCHLHAARVHEWGI